MHEPDGCLVDADLTEADQAAQEGAPAEELAPGAYVAGERALIVPLRRFGSGGAVDPASSARCDVLQLGRSDCGWFVGQPTLNEERNEEAEGPMDLDDQPGAPRL